MKQTIEDLYIICLLGYRMSWYGNDNLFYPTKEYVDSIALYIEKNHSWYSPEYEVFMEKRLMKLLR